MIKRGDKRASHVGIILSFVIFVTFLLFLYSALEPSFKTGEDKENILNSLEKELIGEFSTELTTILISFPPGEEAVTCVEVGLSELELGNNFIVKDGEEIVVSFFGSGNLQIDSDKSFFKAYFSEEEFIGESFDGGSCGVGKIGSVLVEEYVFESRVVDFINDFENKNLNVPEENKVGIIFKNNKDVILAETETGESNSEVYIRDVPVQYIDNEANIKPGVINIRIW